MISLLLLWFLSALALYITSRLVSDFQVKSFSSALIASVVIGFLNMILRPLLLLLTLPLNILTLGLFTFVVNAIILKAASGLLKGFDIKSWGTAILGAVILAIVQVVLNIFVPIGGV